MHPAEALLKRRPLIDNWSCRFIARFRGLTSSFGSRVSAAEIRPLVQSPIWQDSLGQLDAFLLTSADSKACYTNHWRLFVSSVCLRTKPVSYETSRLNWACCPISSQSIYLLSSAGMSPQGNLNARKSFITCFVFSEAVTFCHFLFHPQKKSAKRNQKTVRTILIHRQIVKWKQRSCRNVFLLLPRSQKKCNTH